MRSEADESGSARELVGSMEAIKVKILTLVRAALLVAINIAVPCVQTA
eukprot:SAG11_NODE_314_length_10874_cov_12.170302_2_plen_48_part_00